jgi:hypothetical protein
MNEMGMKDQKKRAEIRGRTGVSEKKLLDGVGEVVRTLTGGGGPPRREKVHINCSCARVRGRLEKRHGVNVEVKKKWRREDSYLMQCNTNETSGLAHVVEIYVRR